MFSKTVMSFLLILSMYRNDALGQSTSSQKSRLPELLIKSTPTVNDTLKANSIGILHAQIANLGNAPLRIYRVRPSCNCTNVVYPKAAIPPGDSAGILFYVNTERKAGFQKLTALFVDNTYEKYHLMKINFYVESPRKGAKR